MPDARQEPLAFEDPYEARVLPRAGWPFWTLNQPKQNGGLGQHVYRLEDMGYVLRNCRKDLDTYMSQAFFSKRNRRALNIAWITHAYVDLDLYRLPTHPNAREAVQSLRIFCDDEGIPTPSLIVFSGRGLYLKWSWSTPLPRAAAGRAVAVNRALVRKFIPWGADPHAVDMSRILRVVGSVNSKSGERAEVLWQEQVNGNVLTYDFDLFCDEVLPYTMNEIRTFREEGQARRAEVKIISHERARRQAQRESERVRSGGHRPFVPEHWHWGVVEDLRELARLRYPGGVVEEGHRALFGHLGAAQLAMVIPAGQLWYEILAWGRIMLPSGYIGRGDGGELHQHCSSLLRRAQADAAGHGAEYKGRRVSQRYTYRRATLIERLGVTASEMPRMTRLIDADEKRRRDREKWRADHTGQDRMSYEATAAGRAQRARSLRDGGLTWQEVGRRLEVTEDAARKLAARA